MRVISEDIRNKNFKQVYLLYGEEPYLSHMYRNQLLRALEVEDGSMNFNRYAGKDTAENDVIAQAETMPFFADYRVMLLEDTGFFKNKADLLAEYLKNLPEYLVMIFVESEVDKRSKMYKAVQKAGHAAEFARQDDEALVRWVGRKINAEHKKITRRTLEHFLEITGNDLTNIDSEFEKLIAYTGDREVITDEDIDAVCVPQMTNRIFEMMRLVTEHQQKKALDYYYDLLALKEPPMRILFLLTRQFHQILQVKELAADGFPNREIASKLGMPPFVVGKTLTLAQKYTTAQLRQIMEECLQTEADVKTGRLEDKLSVEMLIVKYSAG